MRFLFLNDSFYPDPAATAQYLGELALHLVQQGHEVTVLAGRRGYGSEQRHERRETWQGVEIVRVWSPGAGVKRSAGWRRVVHSFFLNLNLCRAGLRGPRPDVVVALTSPPLVGLAADFIARWHRAELVHWIMDLYPDVAEALGWLALESGLARFCREALHRSYRRSARVIVLDRFMRDRLLRQRLSAAKIAVVPLWMQPLSGGTPEGRAALRQRFDWEGRYVIMHAGNHGACHSLRAALKAARILRHDRRFIFCFVGGGSNFEPPTGGAREERSNCRHLPYVPAHELGPLLATADLHLVAMNPALVGIVHPCKPYNLLAVRRPFVVLGEGPNSISDLIVAAQLGGQTLILKEDDTSGLVAEIIRRSAAGGPASWPEESTFRIWKREAVLEEITSLLTTGGR